MQSGQSIYLDYQASTPLDPRVYQAMVPYQTDVFANPHSVAHILGQQSAAVVDSARVTLEQFIGAGSEEVIFTSGATESNNQAVASVLFANSNTERNTVLISEVEHKCVKNSAYFFANKLGYNVKEIPVLSSGLIDEEAYQNLLSDNVILVCIMAVNNEIGTIQDVKKLASMAHDVGALFHCDAAQAPEAIDIDVVDWNVDMLSLSAHKIYGPKGIGLLYMKNTLQATLPPLIQGGGQQFGMRSGTLATALCVGFAKAVSIAKDEAKLSRSRLVKLRNHFKQGLQDNGVAFSINGTEIARHPGNFNIAFDGVNSTTLLEQLQPQICASTGSACNSDMILLSHVLKGIGLTDEQAMSSVRFSLGRFSNEAQVDKVVSIIKTTLESNY